MKDFRFCPQRTANMVEKTDVQILWAFFPRRMLSAPLNKRIFKKLTPSLKNLSYMQQGNFNGISRNDWKIFIGSL